MNKFLVSSLIILILILGISLNISQGQLQSIKAILNDVWDRQNNRLMTTTNAGAQGSFESEIAIFNNIWDKDNHFLRTSGGGGAGSGDVSSNTSTSVDSEAVIFSGTGGKTVKRSTLTGIIKQTSGVQSVATPGVDYLKKSTAAFSAVTSVAITGLSSTDVIVQCWDGSSPRNLLSILSATISATGTNDVTVTFNTAQTGRCVVEG